MGDIGLFKERLLWPFFSSDIQISTSTLFSHELTAVILNFQF